MELVKLRTTDFCEYDDFIYETESVHWGSYQENISRNLTKTITKDLSTLHRRKTQQIGTKKTQASISNTIFPKSERDGYAMSYYWILSKNSFKNYGQVVILMFIFFKW